MKEGTVKTGRGQAKQRFRGHKARPKETEDVSDLSGGKDSVVCEWVQCAWPEKGLICTWVVERERGEARNQWTREEASGRRKRKTESRVQRRSG